MRLLNNIDYKKYEPPTHRHYKEFQRILAVVQQIAAAKKWPTFCRRQFLQRKYCILTRISFKFVNNSPLSKSTTTQFTDACEFPDLNQLKVMERLLIPVTFEIDFVSIGLVICLTPLASFTKDVNPLLAKSPL